MTQSRNPVSRPMVGVLALVCLITGAALGFVPSSDAKTSSSSDSATAMWRASFVRVGLVMGAFWIALPGRGRAAAWEGLNGSTVFAAVFAVFLAARFRQAVIPLIIAAVVAGLVLRPRAKDRPAR